MAREYKDSGIEWIGRIPKQWNITKLGSLYAQRNEKVSDKDFPPLSVTMQGILPQLETAAKTDDGDNRKLVKKGDFAINSRSDRRGSCGISQYDGSVSLINTILKPRGEMNPLFYNWLFHTSLFADEFYKWGHGIVDDLWTTRWQEMKNISVAVPSLSEQQIIADYLDEKCGKIDSLISLQEQMIAQLTDYKQSVITEAVTKGLDSNAQLVSSGIDWIGNIPSGWKVCKLKYNYTLLNGRAYLDPELLEDGKYRILRVGNLFSSDKWYYSDLELEDDKYCEAGDLLYGWSASIGPYIWEQDKVIYHYHIWKVLYGNNDLHFSFYLLKALTLAKQRDMHGSAMQHLTKTNMDNSFIAIPSHTEQREIASYLDTKCGEIDSIIALKQKKIETLKDYKKSLIFEAVTGKIEVV